MIDQELVPIVGMLVPITITLGAFGMVVLIRRFENAERIAMIDKGMDPGLAKQKGTPFGTLRFGLLAVGAGIGLLFGNLLERAAGVDDDVAYFSMIFIFGGIGLLAAYVLQLRQDTREREREKRERQVFDA